jgi:hypothetical protein
MKTVLLASLEKSPSNEYFLSNMAFIRAKAPSNSHFDFVSEVKGCRHAREKINMIMSMTSNALRTIYPSLLIKKLRAYGLNHVHALKEKNHFTV